MKLALIDDEQQQLQLLSQMIHTALIDHGIHEVDIQCFSDAEADS